MLWWAPFLLMVTMVTSFPNLQHVWSMYSNTRASINMNARTMTETNKLLI